MKKQNRSGVKPPADDSVDFLCGKPYTPLLAYFSMLEKLYTVPAFVSTSKSKDLVEPELRAKLTQATSSNLMCTGGLCTYMKPRSRGYRKPLDALYVQLTDCAPERLKTAETNIHNSYSGNSDHESEYSQNNKSHF